MNYRVYWTVNDGHYGYPNNVAELSWGEYTTSTYLSAILLHAHKHSVRWQYRNTRLCVREVGRGRIRGVNYRDFIVSCLSKNGRDEVFEQEIRVFCLNKGKCYE